MRVEDVGAGRQQPLELGVVEGAQLEPHGRSGLPPPKPNGSRWGDDGSPGAATLERMSRAGVALLVCLTLAASAAAPAPASPRTAATALARERALDAYTAMQRVLLPCRRRLLRRHLPVAGPRTGLAVLPGALGDARARLDSRGRPRRARRPPLAGCGPSAPTATRRPGVRRSSPLPSAARASSTTTTTSGSASRSSRRAGSCRGRAPLATAREIFTLVGDGWDFDADDPCPGGVFWKRTGQNHDRNTVTTANAALLALRLDETLGSQANLSWALGAYAWTKRCLGEPNGLVADHIDRHGVVDPHTWSYNQGAMIAAGVHLYRATGKRQLPGRRGADGGRRPARRSATRSARASRRSSWRSSTATCSTSDRRPAGAPAPRGGRGLRRRGLDARPQPGDGALQLRRARADAARPGGDGPGLRGARARLRDGREPVGRLRGRRSGSLSGGIRRRDRGRRSVGAMVTPSCVTQ